MIPHRAMISSSFSPPAPTIRNRGLLRPFSFLTETWLLHIVRNILYFRPLMAMMEDVRSQKAALPDKCSDHFRCFFRPSSCTLICQRADGTPGILPLPVISPNERSQICQQPRLRSPSRLTGIRLTRSVDILRRKGWFLRTSGIPTSSWTLYHGTCVGLTTATQEESKRSPR